MYVPPAGGTLAHKFLYPLSTYFGSLKRRLNINTQPLLLLIKSRSDRDMLPYEYNETRALGLLVARIVDNISHGLRLARDVLANSWQWWTSLVSSTDVQDML